MHDQRDMEQILKILKLREGAVRMYECVFALPEPLTGSVHISIEIKNSEGFDLDEFRQWFSEIIQKNIDEFISSDVHYLCDQMFSCIAREYPDRKVVIKMPQTVDNNVVVEYN
jgi:hypothetical protein